MSEELSCGDCRDNDYKNCIKGSRASQINNEGEIHQDCRSYGYGAAGVYTDDFAEFHNHGQLVQTTATIRLSFMSQMLVSSWTQKSGARVNLGKFSHLGTSSSMVQWNDAHLDLGEFSSFDIYFGMETGTKTQITNSG